MGNPFEQQTDSTGGQPKTTPAGLTLVEIAVMDKPVGTKPAGNTDDQAGNQTGDGRTETTPGGSDRVAVNDRVESQDPDAQRFEELKRVSDQLQVHDSRVQEEDRKLELYSGNPSVADPEVVRRSKTTIRDEAQAAIDVAEKIDLNGENGVVKMRDRNYVRIRDAARELGLLPASTGSDNGLEGITGETLGAIRQNITPEAMIARYNAPGTTAETRQKLEDLRKLMERDAVYDRLIHAQSFTNLRMADQTSKGNTSPELKLGEDVPQGQYMDGFRYLMRARLHEEETKYTEPGARVSAQVLDGLKDIYRDSQTTTDMLKLLREGTEAGGQQDRVTERDRFRRAAEMASSMDLATIIDQAGKPENIDSGLSKEMVGMVTIANGAKLEYANILVREGKYDEAARLFDSVKAEDFRNANLYRQKGDLMKEREDLDKSGKSEEEKARERERIDQEIKRIDATAGPMLIYGVGQDGQITHRQYGNIDTAALENKLTLGVTSVQPQAWDNSYNNFVKNLKAGNYGENGANPSGAFKDIRDMYKANTLMRRDIEQRNQADQTRKTELERERQNLGTSDLSESARKIRQESIDQEIKILDAKVQAREQQIRQQERMTKYMNGLLAQGCDDIGTARGLYKEVNDDIIKQFEEQHPEARGRGAEFMKRDQYKDDPLVKLKGQLELDDRMHEVRGGIGGWMERNWKTVAIGAAIVVGGIATGGALWVAGAAGLGLAATAGVAIGAGAAGGALGHWGGESIARQKIAGVDSLIAGAKIGAVEAAMIVAPYAMAGGATTAGTGLTMAAKGANLFKYSLSTGFGISASTNTMELAAGMKDLRGAAMGTLMEGGSNALFIGAAGKMPFVKPGVMSASTEAGAFASQMGRQVLQNGVWRPLAGYTVINESAELLGDGMATGLSYLGQHNEGAEHAYRMMNGGSPGEYRWDQSHVDGWITPMVSSWVRDGYDPGTQRGRTSIDQNRLMLGLDGTAGNALFVDRNKARPFRPTGPGSPRTQPFFFIDPERGNVY